MPYRVRSPDQEPGPSDRFVMNTEPFAPHGALMMATVSSSRAQSRARLAVSWAAWSSSVTPQGDVLYFSSVAKTAAMRRLKKRGDVFFWLSLISSPCGVVSPVSHNPVMWQDPIHNHLSECWWVSFWIGWFCWGRIPPTGHLAAFLKETMQISLKKVLNENTDTCRLSKEITQISAFTIHPYNHGWLWLSLSL